MQHLKEVIIKENLSKTYVILTRRLDSCLLGNKGLCLWAPFFNLIICQQGDLYWSPHSLNAFTFILETEMRVNFYHSSCYFEIEHLADWKTMNGTILFYNLEGSELHCEGIKFSQGVLLALASRKVIILSTPPHFPPELLLTKWSQGISKKKAVLPKQRL